MKAYHRVGVSSTIKSLMRCHNAYVAQTEGGEPCFLLRREPGDKAKGRVGHIMELFDISCDFTTSHDWPVIANIFRAETNNIIMTKLDKMAIKQFHFM